jgi:hypothetical protein
MTNINSHLVELASTLANSASYLPGMENKYGKGKMRAAVKAKHSF